MVSARVPGCTCPDAAITRPTADDFDRMAACVHTSEDDRALFRRSALRIRQRALRIDPRAITFDAAFIGAEAERAEIRRQHSRAFLKCQCPICDVPKVQN